MLPVGFISRRSITLLCVLLILSSIASYFLVQRKFQIEYNKMEMVILNQSNKITNVLSKLLYKTQALASLIIQNNGEIVNFEKTAIAMVDDPAILNLLLAPNGIVTDVYPREGNEAVIGLNFFSKGAGNLEALQAQKSRQMVLGGPFPLVQGGEALVGRLPIYLDAENGEKRFWGLVSVTLKFPQALDGAELDTLQERGLAYQMWRISPDTDKKQVIASSPAYNSETPYIEMPLQILNAQWFFRISPIKFWYEYVESWLYIIIGIVGSLFITALVQHAQDLGRIRRQLEDIVFTDPLTGLLNRRGLFDTLDALIQTNKKFYLCYLDLNKFKFINDTYGHTIGDNVLRFFTNEVQRLTQSMPNTFARMGGDEFIIVFKDDISEEEITNAFSVIHTSLQTAKIVSDDQFKISFSIGMAQYPRDGKTVDDLINHADKNMYMHKQAGRNK